jgi:hypothetical protein
VEFHLVTPLIAIKLLRSNSRAIFGVVAESVHFRGAIHHEIGMIKIDRSEPSEGFYFKKCAVLSVGFLMNCPSISTKRMRAGMLSPRDPAREEHGLKSARAADLLRRHASDF